MKEYIDTTNITEHDIATITENVIKIMKYILSFKICYRDVKMHNLIVNPNTLSVKLIDIGLLTYFPNVDELRENINKVE